MPGSPNFHALAQAGQNEKIGTPVPRFAAAARSWTLRPPKRQAVPVTTNRRRLTCSIRSTATPHGSQTWQ